MRVIHGTRDPALSATIVERRALWYSAGADAEQDRPAHVRAGSGLAAVGGRLVVVQDDANFLAVIDPVSGSVDHVALPRGDGGLRQFDDRRGNKEAKLDLEACVAFEEAGERILVAFGSGATSRRERIVWVAGVDGAAPVVEYIDGSLFYAKLRGLEEFAPTGLNLEGVVIPGDGGIWFANRGTIRNGKVLNGLVRFDQREMVRILLAPGEAPGHLEGFQVDLGVLDGIPLGITDLAPHPRGLLFVAAAEATSNAVEDGRVTGSVMGVITPAGEATWTPLLTSDGGIFPGKVEGVTMLGGRTYAVVDDDAADEPATLLTLEFVQG